MSGGHKYDLLLGGLPPKSKVAVITMTGSCCPVTLAHIHCFIAAKQIFLGEAERPRELETFDAALGFLSLNPDSHVRWKMSQKGEKAISFRDRAHLVELATDSYMWMSFNDRG